MSISNYNDLKSSIADFLNRDDLTAVIPTFIELAEADMSGVGPSICRTMLAKDICDLQPWARQLPETLFQSSPDGVILQRLQHLIWADGAANGLGCDMGVARRSAEFGVPQ